MGSNRLPPCVDTVPFHNPFLGHWQHGSQIRIHQGANLLALSLLTTPGFLLPCPPPRTPPPPPSFLTCALRALPPEAFDVDTIEPVIFVLSNLEGQSINITGWSSSNMTRGQISRPHRAETHQSSDNVHRQGCHQGLNNFTESKITLKYLATHHGIIWRSGHHGCSSIPHH